MRKVVALGLVGAFVSGSFGTAFGLSGLAPVYTLQYRPTVGRALHYDMNMKMTGGAGMSLTSSFTITATKHAAGKYTVVTTIDSMTAPGAPPDQMKKMLKGSRLTQVMDENGKQISASAEGMMKMMSQSGSMGSTSGLYPGKPVHVGDSWVGTSDAAGAKSKAKVKLMAVRTMGGKQVAVLQVIPMTQASPMATTGTIMVTIEIATGIMRSTELSGAMGSGAQASSMHATVKLR